MSKRSDFDLLEDILVCIGKIQAYISHLDYDQFRKDTKTQDAVIRNIEIIGEAAKMLSEEIKIKNSDIPWKAIAGTRDRLIHGYFGVNIDVVWDIATIDIPEIKKNIEKLKK